MPIPDTDVTLVDPGKPWRTRYLCGACGSGEHEQCTGERSTGEPCECGWCAGEA